MISKSKIEYWLTHQKEHPDQITFQYIAELISDVLVKHRPNKWHERTCKPINEQANGQVRLLVRSSYGVGVAWYSFKDNVFDWELKPGYHPESVEFVVFEWMDLPLSNDETENEIRS